MKNKSDSKGIELTSQINSNTPQFFKTDANRLTQIIINLVSNAIKYTDSGFVKINC